MVDSDGDAFAKAITIKDVSRKELEARKFKPGIKIKVDFSPYSNTIYETVTK